MGIVLTTSWVAEDADDGPTSVAVSGFQPGDVALVQTFSFSNVTDATHDVPTDNGSNVYTERVQNVRDGTFRCICAISDAVIVTPPTSIEFAISNATGVGQTIVVWRLTGVDIADRFRDADENLLTADDPTSDAVDVLPGDFVVACITYDGDNIPITEPSGWTMGSVLQTSISVAFASAYKIATAAGTLSAGWTTGSSHDYAMGIASYKAMSTPSISRLHGLPRKRGDKAPLLRRPWIT